MLCRFLKSFCTRGELLLRNLVEYRGTRPVNSFANNLYKLVSLSLYWHKFTELHSTLEIYCEVVVSRSLETLFRLLSVRPICDRCFKVLQTSDY